MTADPRPAPRAGRAGGGPLILSPRLLDVPMVALSPITMADANRLLVAWGHRLGEIHRPFTQQAFALELDGAPVSVTVSASVVSATVAGDRRMEVVECARLCSAPGYAWASRVMLRLWREVCAPRFDGWTKVKDDCGSNGGGAWTRPRYAGEAVYGKKRCGCGDMRGEQPSEADRAAERTQAERRAVARWGGNFGCAALRRRVGTVSGD